PPIARWLLRRPPLFRGRGTMAPLLARRSKGGNRGEVGSVALQLPAATRSIGSRTQEKSGSPDFFNPRNPSQSESGFLSPGKMPRTLAHLVLGFGGCDHPAFQAIREEST